jgi:HTH-type transcriptional regulator/antitoxin MqsA
MDDFRNVLHLAQERAELPPPSEMRSLRIRSGLSAAEVARAVGVSRQAVLNWEKGRSRPRPANLSSYLMLIRALSRG